MAANGTEGCPKPPCDAGISVCTGLLLVLPFAPETNDQPLPE